MQSDPRDASRLWAPQDDTLLPSFWVKTHGMTPLQEVHDWARGELAELGELLYLEGLLHQCLSLSMSVVFVSVTQYVK